MVSATVKGKYGRIIAVNWDRPGQPGQVYFGHSYAWCGYGENENDESVVGIPSWFCIMSKDRGRQLYICERCLRDEGFVW